MNTNFIKAICARDPMANAGKLSWVEHLLRTVLDFDVPGAIVEVGAHRGSTTAMLTKVSLDYQPTREVVAYESFLGLPLPTEEDAGAFFEAGEMQVDMSSFNDTFDTMGLPSARLVIGGVEETMPSLLPDSVCFAFIDVHRFRGTLHALDSIYPFLSVGGVLLIDDYCDPSSWPYAWNGAPGVFKAVDKFKHHHQEDIRIVLAAKDDLSLAYLRKSI